MTSAVVGAGSFSRFVDIVGVGSRTQVLIPSIPFPTQRLSLVASVTLASLGLGLVFLRHRIPHLRQQQITEMEAEAESGGRGGKKGKKSGRKGGGGPGNVEVDAEIPPPPQTPGLEEGEQKTKGKEAHPQKEKDGSQELHLLGSREAERNLLILLNKRLERIIEKNRQLQQANNQLMTELEVEKQQCSAKVTEVTVKANGELEKARNDLANAKKEITVLTFKLGTVKKDGDDARNRLERALDEISRLKKQIADLESQLANVTSQLKKETEHKNKLDRELNEWKDEAIKLGQVLQETKTELEKEILAKLDLEQQLKGEIDEKTMKTTLIETEMVQLKATANQMLHEQNAKQQKEFENLLERNMKNLRDEYSRKLVENKEEQTRLYEVKERDHITNKEQLSYNLKTKKEELEKIQKEVKTLIENVRRLETERHALLVQLDDLETERKAERAKLEAEIENRDKLLKVKIAEQNELLNRCQNLLDIKVALDNELAAYKTMLETEETRLEIGEYSKKDENQNFVQQTQPQTA